MIEEFYGTEGGRNNVPYLGMIKVRVQNDQSGALNVTFSNRHRGPLPLSFP